MQNLVGKKNQKIDQKIDWCKLKVTENPQSEGSFHVYV